MKNLLVFVDNNEKAPVNVSLEVLSQAKRLANQNGVKAFAAVIAPKSDIKEVADKLTYGEDKVFGVAREAVDLGEYANVLATLAKNNDCDSILIGGNQFGKDLAGVLANQLNTVAASNVVAIAPNGDNLVFATATYGGSILNDLLISDPIKVGVVRTGSFKKEEGTLGAFEEVEVTPLGNLLTTIKDAVKEITDSVNLEEAEIIVCGGRGMGSEENFKLVQDLADALGGVVGATRPATEAGWAPRNLQIGQSGKIVAPKLYIACGVSGATQHISGAISSGYIVSINKDEDAPIFSVSDVGIVGNVTDVLPLFTAEVKKIKG